MGLERGHQSHSQRSEQYRKLKHDQETYLAGRFNHGATLVNVFGWGISGPSVKGTNPFRIVTEGRDALATYRKFLSQ